MNRNTCIDCEFRKENCHSTCGSYMLAMQRREIIKQVKSSYLEIENYCKGARIREIREKVSSVSDMSIGLKRSVDFDLY